jgi:hypothetical protein
MTTAHLPRTRVEVLEFAARKRPTHVVDADERLAIEGLLIWHRFSVFERAWMAPTCPSLAVALQLYPIEPRREMLLVSVHLVAEVAA